MNTARIALNNLLAARQRNALQLAGKATEYTVKYVPVRADDLDGNQLIEAWYYEDGLLQRANFVHADWETGTHTVIAIDDAALQSLVGLI